MDTLRAVELADIPQVVALRRRAFTQSAQASDRALCLYYQMLFFENPWRDARYSSLVHEDTGGRIIGFIGLIPRPMLLGDERITAITTTELMVTPEARGFVGPKLLRRAFDGPQDLAYSDRTNSQARALFESLGGSTALWYSLYWSVSLDGRRLSFDAHAGPRTHGIASRAVRRASGLFDRLSTRLTRVRSSHLPTRDEPLSPDIVIGLVRKLSARNTLVPDYDARSFQWLLERLAERKNAGRLVACQVIKDSDPIGSFVYAIRPNGDTDVAHLVSLPGRESLVWDHLLRHASNEGGIILRGRLDRRFAPIISELGAPLTVGQPWTVVRSRRQDVATQFLNGNAFFSRLDAEWWIDA